jgi:hypothetical protein
VKERTEVCAEGHLRQRGRVNTLRHHALEASRIVSYSDINTRKQKTLSIFYSYRIGRPMSCLDDMTCFESSESITNLSNREFLPSDDENNNDFYCCCSYYNTINSCDDDADVDVYMDGSTCIHERGYVSPCRDSKILYSRLYRIAH